MEPLVDTVIEDPRWEDLLPPLAESAARATLANQCSLQIGHINRVLASVCV